MRIIPHSNKSIWSIIAEQLLYCVIVVSSCVYTSSFVDEYTFPKWIIFGLGSGVIFIYSSLLYFKRNCTINVDIINLVILLTVVLLYLLFKATKYDDVFHWITFGMFSLASIMLKDIINIVKTVAIAIISGAMISSIRAITQIFVGHELTGCYDNLVGFDITLLLGMISILYILRHNFVSKRVRLILWGMILLFCCLALLTKSRLVVVAIAAITSLYIPVNKKYIVISGVVLLCLVTFLSSKKLESTYGRGFILKTSISLLDSPNHILSGYGEDGFCLNYMTRQSELLKEDSDLSRERASNIIHPLNEFLLISIKYGILLPLVLILISGALLLSKKINNSSLSILYVLLIYSFFSYPLRYPISWIAVGIVFSTISTKFYSSSYIKNPKLCAIIATTIGVAMIVNSSNIITLNLAWKNAHNLAILGKIKQASEEYERLAERLKSDEFIYNYSSYLLNIGKFTEAKYKMSEIRLIDYETTMLSGTINQSLGLYNDALNDFHKANSMCPNRFLPLFEIYKIHEKTNNKDGMSTYAKIINNKHIKVQSAQIDYIINYVNKNSENQKLTVNINHENVF